MIISIHVSIRNIPIHFEIKDTTACFTSPLHLDILLKLHTNGKLTTQLFDKQDNFKISIVNFSFLCCKISIIILICKDLFYIRLVFNSKQSTGIQVDVTGVSTAFCKVYGRSKDIVCLYHFPLG
jgi:hypothetical protein